MKITDIGEFGLIQRIARFLPPTASDVVVGIGDDVAVLSTLGPDYLLATCDIQVEGVHFLKGAITAPQLGKRIAAINVSDIAAMGGTPLWALVSLALPAETDVAFVDGLYEGMQEQLQASGAAIVGGNLSKIGSGMVIDLCLLGRVKPDHLVLRSRAKENDLILVTGTLGDSRAGLELIRKPGLAVPQSSRKKVLQRHLTPQPRLAEGQILGACGQVHAMVDVSDGLMSDIRHICRASGLGAEIWVDGLPVSPSCADVARICGADAFSWAMTGREDYELLFAVHPRSAGEVQRLVEMHTGITCSVIGKMLPGEAGIQAVFPGGKKVAYSLGDLGWDHFSRRADTPSEVSNE